MRDIHNSYILLLFFPFYLTTLSTVQVYMAWMVGFILNNDMQTMVQEAALGNMRKYRVIWLGRLRQDNLFRDREFQQGPIEYKTWLINTRQGLSMYFTGRKFVEVRFRSRRQKGISRSQPPTYRSNRGKVIQVKFYLCLTKHLLWKCMGEWW